MTDAYITGAGAYLPGEPVDNERLAEQFGDGSTREAALPARALAANGIRTRHYAVDGKSQTLMLNEERAAHAVRHALRHRGLQVADVRMLATATTPGDLLIPPVRMDSSIDGPAGGYEHAVRCEYAHPRLLALREAACLKSSAAATWPPAGHRRHRAPVRQP